MRSTTYRNYIKLLNLLLANGELTYEEICLIWDDDPTIETYPPIRTFHEYKKGIKEMFGVDIECDRSRRTNPPNGCWTNIASLRGFMPIIV